MRQIFSVSLLLFSVSSLVQAQNEYSDHARVLSATPQVERINTPVKECRTEYVQERVYEPRYQERSYTGGVIGGIAGGLLGNTIGRGKGRIAAAAVGAGVGAMVGDRLSSQSTYGGEERFQSRPVERCVMIDNWDSITTGYLVQYEYQGRQYSTIMDYDPGNSMPVMVAVRTLGRNTAQQYRPASFRDKTHHHSQRSYW